MDVSFLKKNQNRWLTSVYTKWIIKHHNLVISSKTKWIFRWTMISPCIQVGFIPVHSVRLICWVPLMKDDDWLQTTNKWWLNSIECFHCSYLKQWFYCFFHLLTNFKMVLFRTGGWDQTEPTNGSPRKTLGHFPSTLIRAEKKLIRASKFRWNFRPLTHSVVIVGFGVDNISGLPFWKVWKDEQ